MGIVSRDIELVGERKVKTLHALFDSGAYRNYIRRVLFDKDSIEQIGFRAYAGPDFSILADGSLVGTEKVAFNELRIQGIVSKNPTFQVMESLSHDVIIGVELMQTLGMVLDLPRHRFYFGNDPETTSL